MDRLNPLRTGSALALTAAVISLVCTLAVLLFPDGMVNFVNAWVHGLDLGVLKSSKELTVGGLAYGLFGVSLATFLGGMLFAVCYNLTGKCLACRRES